MARVVITVTDNPDGTVRFDTEPKVALLLDRKKKHGIASLSPGEQYAIIALNHMLVTSEQAKKEGKSGIILPPGIMS